MKQIIEALKSKLSLEEEFELNKQIIKITKEKNIDQLKNYTINLQKTYSRQQNFINMALEIICEQQEQIINLQQIKYKKKATIFSRLKYIFFGKS